MEGSRERGLSVGGVPGPEMYCEIVAVLARHLIIEPPQLGCLGSQHFRHRVRPCCGFFVWRFGFVESREVVFVVRARTSMQYILVINIGKGVATVSWSSPSVEKNSCERSSSQSSIIGSENISRYENPGHLLLLHDFTLKPCLPS